MMFIKNLGAFADALGIENAPTIVYMSLVPWPSETERDEFILALTDREPDPNYGE